MAGRGSRTVDGGRDEPGAGPGLVRLYDRAGRPRGTGFAVDHDGTVVTGHEAVDGIDGLLFQGPDERVCVVGAEAVTPLPHAGLALVRTEGLGLAPLPVTARDRIEAGTYVRIAAGGWREARVLGTTPVTYRAQDRPHHLDAALELAIGTAGTEALRTAGGAAGGPVLDARTGAVLAVLGTALHTEHRTTGLAVPLRGLGQRLEAVLARNAETVAAYGPDLNLAGVLALTGAATPATTGPYDAHFGPEPVRRAAALREFAAFEKGSAAVLGLVGPPGSGRTTELASLAARRTRGPRPAPVLWLRGVDLEGPDTSLADAARRALERAYRIMEAPGAGTVHGADGRAGRPCDLGPESLARVARNAGRPLLLLLDDPEWMPLALAPRLPEWTAATAAWLRETGSRLVVACREEYWESAGAQFPGEMLHRRCAPAPEPPENLPALLPACTPTRTGEGPTVAPRSPAPLPPCVRLATLTPEEAHRARARHGIPDGLLDGTAARHPLTLRLFAEVRAALPAAVDSPGGSTARRARINRDDVLSAHLDLMCLRIARRLAAWNGLRGTAVRRLAAKVSGQVHEAARHCLGSGQGALDHATFQAVFPGGPAPAPWLGRIEGWHCAVLAERLFVPVPGGYRFAREDLADRLQGMHLDLDTALHTLVHARVRGAVERPVSALAASAAVRRRDRAVLRTVPSRALPVPRHRIGPVVQALLLLPGHKGHAELALRLEELVHSLDTLPPSRQDPQHDAVWWATHLLTGTVLRLADATPYLHALRLLAEHVVRRRARGLGVPGELGPWFWEALPVSGAERLDLLRRLVAADEAPRTADGIGPEHDAGPVPASPGVPRYLDAVARLLAADVVAVQRELTRWFDDERPLPATPHATVATAAQALLYTHRHRELDHLTEALLDSAHRRGEELLAVLAEEEPSAVCRAVDRWAHDERPARRTAAVAHGLRAAPHVRIEADRELLRHAALAMLARPADCTAHGGALALLVHDPLTRDRYLPQALTRFAAGDPQLPVGALVPALATHPEPVLDAFRPRLRQCGPDADDTLSTLVDAATPALARRVARLLRDLMALHPEPDVPSHDAGPPSGLGEQIAAHVGRYLEHGRAHRAVLLPLVTGLLDGGPAELRAALAAALAAPGSAESRPLRWELLDLLLAQERDPMVLERLLRAAADGLHRGGEEHARHVIHRVGLLLARTGEGAAHFDRGLFDLARHVPGFARLLARWLTEAPGEWAVLVGPSARRMIENLGGLRIPA
ncbi:trypsin-like peptidase domain-containing protein [Streptomyces sp. NPDC101149]|uniref:trypsin-like peptidase domain-containing protein n=1 Tax=Streptomyces sp. NPDC101149 TaxID=3366113 RepID=UPI0038267AE0